MGRDPKTLIVVPCYNEADRLDRTEFERAIETRPWLFVHFVDDGSSDRTREVLDDLARRSPERISLTISEVNQGKAEAVRVGMLHALDSNAELVGYFDADLATPFGELDGMRALLLDRGALMVLASRVRLLGREIERKSSRHYAGRVFATAASMVLRLSVYDTQCGAKLFQSGEITREVFQTPFRSRWIFDVEVLARLSRIEQEKKISLFESQILEYPLKRWSDVDGSRIDAKSFARAALDLARIALDQRRGSADP